MVLLILSTLLVLIFYYRVQVVTSFLLSLYVVVSLVNSFGSKVKELKELLVISKYLIPR